MACDNCNLYFSKQCGPGFSLPQFLIRKFKALHSKPIHINFFSLALVLVIEKYLYL